MQPEAYRRDYSRNEMYLIQIQLAADRQRAIGQAARALLVCAGLCALMAPAGLAWQVASRHAAPAPAAGTAIPAPPAADPMPPEPAWP